jgi:outer membrane immunogenic protein
MKRFWLGTAAVAGLLSGPAIAADMPVKARAAAAPADPWSGFYIGLNAGGAWGRSDATTAVDCSPNNVPPAYLCAATFAQANGPAVDNAGSGTLKASGFTGGGQLGYNLRAGSNVVFGFETDFDAFTLTGSRKVGGLYPVNAPGPSAGQAFTVGSSFDTDWLFTLRGRLGFLATPDWLIYATGGLAVTNLQVTNSFTDATNAGASESASTTTNKVGWTVGGGVQWALSRNWSVKAEYLYLNFGGVTANGIITNASAGAGYAQGISTSANLTTQVARGGINYKF